MTRGEALSHFLYNMIDAKKTDTPNGIITFSAKNDM